MVKIGGASVLRKPAEIESEHPAVAPTARDRPGVHVIASPLKRWLTGTLHSTVTQEQLSHYREPRRRPPTHLQLPLADFPARDNALVST